MFPVQSNVLPFGEYHSYSHRVALRPGKRSPSDSIDLLRSGNGADCLVICDGMFWKTHIAMVSSYLPWYKTMDKKSRTITIKGYRWFEVDWILQYLYQRFRIDFHKAHELNPSRSMLDTAVRLSLIAKALGLTDLADYAEQVYDDYDSMTNWHFDQAGVTLSIADGDVEWYAREIELASRAAWAREKTNPGIGFRAKLVFKCSELRQIIEPLGVVSRLRADIPGFKRMYDKRMPSIEPFQRSNPGPPA